MTTRLARHSLLAPIHAKEHPACSKPSAYPVPFVHRVRGRTKRRLGQHFGLKNFGVNQTTLMPGAWSSLRHAHTQQDEFIYILEGHPTLVTNAGEETLAPGMCVGFRAGTGNAHHLINHSDQRVVYLEVGDRSAQDKASYPDEDLTVALVDGRWVFSHKDGSSYDEEA